jgi:hypothetical protein
MNISGTWKGNQVGRHFVWLGQRALGCAGLHHLIDFKLILCCDYGLDAELVSSTIGAPIISVEHRSGVRESWSNFDLDRLFVGEMASRIHTALLNHIEKLYFVAYCSTPGFENLALEKQPD